MEKLRELHNFFKTEYIPNSRLGIASSNTTNGKNFYKACLNYYADEESDPDEVHNIGLGEVKRIADGMQEIMKNKSFTGTVKEFIAKLAKEPQYFTDNKTVYLDRVHQLLDKLRLKANDYFSVIPKTPLDVVEMRENGPGAMYARPTEAYPRGRYIINLFDVDKRPLYTLPSLCAHEGIPGHHFQIALQYENKAIPDIRRYDLGDNYYEAPFTFPQFSAYVEGWALYTEYLGREMGLYEDHIEEFGAYADEMLRAMRLVIDTGIHWKGWTRDQAIAYMTKYSPDPPSQIRTEIDRYITWPGQACSYKIGELKIKKLRKNAEAKLGNTFAIKDFHDNILKLGPVPLKMLEDSINRWIVGEEKKRTTPKPSNSTSRLPLPNWITLLASGLFMVRYIF